MDFLLTYLHHLVGQDVGREMSSSYGYGVTHHRPNQPSVADWGDGVSASCTVGPIVR